LKTLKKTIANAVQENAQLLVSFAGHASMHLDKLLLCPFDWKTPDDGISLETIQDLVKDTRSCLLFLDCCSAEQLSLDRMNISDSVQILIPTTNKVHDGELTTGFVKSLSTLSSILPSTAVE
jgi:hypothetical protein